MPEALPPVSPTSVRTDELEIHTIPDSYYGTALKAKVIEEKKVSTDPEAPRKSHLPVFIVAFVLILGIAGGFAYFNRNLLFPPPAVTPPVVQTQKPPEPIPVPTAPSNTAATSTNPQNVLVSWTDTSSNESGFRVERNDGSGTFASVTSLPPNSTSFLDVSVLPKTTYIYRIRALNVSGESDPSVEVATITPDVPPPEPVAPQLPPAGLDTDSDGLADLEEGLYGSNQRMPDTDEDGFLDGNEVFHLYNPSGEAPARLLDLALIRTVEAPLGWTMGVPSGWTVTLDGAGGSHGIFDSKHGETFVLSLEENPTRQPVLDWYLAAHPDASAAQVMQYRSKRGYKGIIGVDQLSTFIPWEDKIFVLTYNLNGQPFINYRTTYSMMLNSLLLSGVPQTPVPTTGEPLPFEPSATTNGVVAQPVPVEETPSSTPPQS